MPVEAVLLVLLTQRRSTLGIKMSVMISSNRDFVLVRQGVQPVDLRLYLVDVAEIGQISSVDEEVAVWNIGLNHAVCI